MGSKKGQVLWVVLVLVALTGLMLAFMRAGSPEKILEEEFFQEEEVVFCTSGKIHIFENQGRQVRAVIQGLQIYKEKEFCKAIEEASFESNGGIIHSEIIRYYNEDESDVYVIIVVDNDNLAQPYRTEIHFVNGRPMEEFSSSL